MFNLIFSQVYSGENVLVSAAFNAALPVRSMWILDALTSFAHGILETVRDFDDVDAQRAALDTSRYEQR